jgi:anion-transporting  ArsA/GET3 family ATPase
MEQARAVFRDADATEFVVVTIPTVMAAAESVRLAAALRTEKVPVHALLVNQARPARLGRRLCAALECCTAWCRTGGPELPAERASEGRRAPAFVHKGPSTQLRRR